MIMIRDIFFVILISGAVAVDLFEVTECVTPYNETAICSAISDCTVISSALLSFTPRVIQFVKDSQCGCHSGMVCCGTSNDKPYPPLINCVQDPQPISIKLSGDSDASVCGLDSTTDKIKGGDVVNEEAFPWLAAIEYKSKLTNTNAGIRCAGSLFTPTFILTAAHCILDVEFEIIQVWLGVNNISSEETCSNSNGKPNCIATVEKLNVVKAVAHQLYNSFTKLNDIGILQVDRPQKYSKYIRPICLLADELPRIGTLLTVVGWGITENDKKSEVKLQVQVPLRENKICQDYLGKLYHLNITSKQLCVGGESNKDSCEGDSGGPLMYQYLDGNGEVHWVQLGIVSYGARCGAAEKPGVYTKVSSYDKWIFNTISNVRDNLGEDEPCTPQYGNSTVGRCVPLQTCKGLVTTILTKSEYNAQIDRDIQCTRSVNIGNPVVCCEKPGPTISTNLDIIPALPNTTTCGISKEESRSKDDKANFPWIAGIEVSENNSTKIRCVGTIISSRYVMTSIECIFGKAEDTFEPTNVWLGRWNTSSHNDRTILNNANTFQKIGIKKSIPYPKFTAYVSGFFPNALILLENEIKFSDYINPICLDNLPKPQIGDTFASITLLNSSSTESITSSDNIVKQEFSVIKCNRHVENFTDVFASCDVAASGKISNGTIGHQIPIMRKYTDTASGRVQWYLVSLDRYDVRYPKHVFTRNINNCLHWIVTVISEYN